MLVNIRSLTNGITSAQSSIGHCKSTLKNIEKELLKLDNTKTEDLCGDKNTNNNHNKKRLEETRAFNAVSDIEYDENNFEGPVFDPNEEINLNNVTSKHCDTILVETDQLQTYNLNRNNLNQIINTRQRLVKQNPKEQLNDHNLEKLLVSKPCRISEDMGNLLRAQQKLICQIDQLKMEIGQKTGLIENCFKDSQFFNCKFKQIDYEIKNLKQDLDSIKKQVTCRGFSQYSNDRASPINQQPNLTNKNKPIKSQNCTCKVRNEPRMKQKTFEEALKKSRVEIDCNINNCRNFQNSPMPATTTNNNASANTGSSLKCNHTKHHPSSTPFYNHQAPKKSSVPYPYNNTTTTNENPLVSSSGINSDFQYLNRQIKNLRKITETIFKNNNSLKNVHKSPSIKTTLSLLTRYKKPSDSVQHTNQPAQSKSRQRPHLDNLSSLSSHFSSMSSLSSSSSLFSEPDKQEPYNKHLAHASEFEESLTNHFLEFVNTNKNKNKKRIQKKIATTSDTSCCILTEEQLATQTYNNLPHPQQHPFSLPNHPHPAKKQ